MERFFEGSLGDLLSEYLSLFEMDSKNSGWLENYHHYVERLKRSNELSSDELEELWCRQKSAVALIRQGVTPLKEFERAKSHLAEITKLVAGGMTEQRYTQCIELMTKLSEQKLISRRYFSVLHRMIVAFDSERLTFPVDEKVMLKFVQFLNEKFCLEIPTKDRNWYQLSSDLKQTISAYLPENVDPLKVNIAIWRINEDKNSLVDSHLVNTWSFNNPSTGESHIMTSSLNQILYGPPGTGKTFHTIEAAVKAAEPTFYLDLNIDQLKGATQEQRAQLQSKFKELSDSKRIRFVTFHQSYGYEEFVEGVKAETVDEKINYKIESGIFKKAVESARAKRVSQLDLSSHYDLSNRKIWKMSLGNTQTDEGEMVFNECIENNYLLLGYGGNINFEGCNSTSKIKEKFIDAGYQLKPQDYNVTSVNTLVNKMSVGDIVIISDGNHKFKAIAEITSNYSFIDDDRDWYFQKRDVKWLMIFDEARPVDELFSSSLSQMTLYNLKDSVISRDKLAHLLNESKQELEEIKNYVLVIDEINRGNISKIFGELITLIEPSKRKGAEEALEVTLPYSGDIFSVPDNLHIIGTMNTADRSLAMMDTALRRRFDFVEMMPKPELFKNRKVRNIDLTELLTTLNKRIEVLYDREHTLGHAFLFPVYNEQDEGKAFELLKAAFKNKIIPLLEEYFFDDWNKIRLVLGDNQKETALCFVTKQEDSYESLFGTNHGLNLYEDTKVTFQLASFDGHDSVWDQPEAYIAIYTKG
ncbi:TPA: AAA family ATPase [Photobacterium damselae]